MWAVARLAVASILVLLILVIVVSPCIDLPLTTVRAQQAGLWLFAEFAMTSAVAAESFRRAAAQQAKACEAQTNLVVRAPNDLTSALLC